MQRRFLSTFLASGALLSSGAFERSAAADDAACVAASEHELSLRKDGKLHAAVKELSVCADARCPDELRSDCAARMDAIQKAMPTLVLAAEDGGGNDLYAVKVTMDGAPLLETLDGRPLSIDPGAHVFRFETSGQPPVDKTLVIREGEKDRHENVVLGSPPAAPRAAAPAVPPEAPPSSWNTRKTLGVVGGAVGLVGVGIGITLGLYASSSQSREKRDCPSVGCPAYAQAKEDYDTARKDATGSTIAFAAGAAFLAAGIVLWVTAPGEPRASGAGSRSFHLAPALLGTSRGLVLGGDL